MNSMALAFVTRSTFNASIAWSLVLIDSNYKQLQVSFERRGVDICHKQHHQ